MKILVDVGVGVAVESVLRDAGHDVVSVRDLDPSMPDLDILARAASEDRLIITMDKDFGELVHRDGHTHAGVLLLRVEEATGVEKARIVREILTQRGDALPGHFSVYQGGSLRVRGFEDSNEDESSTGGTGPS